MSCCRDDCPSGRFFSFSTEKHLIYDRVTISFLFSFPTKALLLWPLSLDGRPALGRVPLVENFLFLIMMETTELNGTADFFLDLLLKAILSLKPTDNSFDIILGVWPLTYSGTLYRQVCGFPSQVQSTYFTTGELHLSCSNISRMIRGNASNLNFITKVVDIWSCLFSKFAKKNKKTQLFPHCHNGEFVFRVFRENINLIQLGIR